MRLQVIVHAMLKTAQGDVDVHLGPALFLDKQPVKIGVGDKVEVTGSQVKLASGPALIAQVVKKGDQSLTLRGADGVPVWAGKGMRGRGPRSCPNGCCGPNCLQVSPAR